MSELGILLDRAAVHVDEDDCAAAVHEMTSRDVVIKECSSRDAGVPAMVQPS